MNKNMVITVVAIALVLFGVAILFFFIGGGDGDTTFVEINTSMGKITAVLYDGKAPITVKNFLKYVDEKHYDGTIFHRVIPDFMIQGGGHTLDLEERRDKYPPIKNESTNGLKNLKGTLAMARTPDPDSATAGFFINVDDNKFLDRANADDKVGYCVFGKVKKGMDVVEKIRRVKTTGPKGQPMANLPFEPPIIISIRRVE